MQSRWALLLLAGGVFSQKPERTQVTIGATSYSGSGCPQGTVSTIISDDRTVVTFGFDKFQAIIGPKADPKDSSKNCNIKLGLNYPGDFQLSVVKATYHGFLRLDDGVLARFSSNYFWASDGRDGRGPRRLPGEVSSC